MPSKKRPRNPPSTDATYRSTDATSPQQQRFPHRRKSIKTYGRSKSARKLKQETLTQMNFTSSAAHDIVDPIDDHDDDGDGDDDGNLEEQEEVGVELIRSVKKIHSGMRSRTNRRKTSGDRLDFEEKPRKCKRRKTLGDTPNLNISSNIHTQTLTQMISTNAKDEDRWQVDDSEDDNDHELVMETPKRSPAHHTKIEPLEYTMSAVPSLVKSATPANRQKKLEIPSSQSPLTPMLLRFSSAPLDSPLATKSTKIAAPSPILKKLCKTPRNAIIPDSYSTTHDSSPASNQKFTLKGTPLKKLSFDLPGDKENITPGRKKPKSPKPRTQATGRRPLQEVPDSDDDLYENLDETECETTEGEEEFGDPESPTPKRVHTTISRAKSLVPENGSPDVIYRPLEEATEQIVPSGSQLLGHQQDLEPCDRIPPPQEHGPASSLLPRLIEQSCHPDSPKIVNNGSSRGTKAELVTNNHTTNQELSSEPSTESEVEVEVETPRPRPCPGQGLADSAAVSEVEGNVKPNLSQKATINDGLSPPWQGGSYLYTQGLESQRLPLDSIRALGPQTPHSDIMVSLHPEHIAKIVDGTKNHEFRAWKIPQQVSRVWIYITRPESQLRYMCLFGEPKAPGEIEDEKGIGNIDFNEGKTAAKFAYEILQVYELNNPVSLDEMKKKGWVSGAPQKYTYIPPAIVGEITANLRCALFGDAAQQEDYPRKKIPESQELKEQLKSEVDYSTQHYSGATDEVIPESQWPRRNNVSSEAATDGGTFVKPAVSGSRPISSNHGSPLLPSQKQSNFVRPSQATTVSQVSSSPAISPEKSRPHPILISSDTGDSPSTLHRVHSHAYSSLQSSQFPSRSQMLPESLLNKDIHEPPSIIWDSADEHSD